MSDPTQQWPGVLHGYATNNNAIGGLGNYPRLALLAQQRYGNQLPSSAAVEEERRNQLLLLNEEEPS